MSPNDPTHNPSNEPVITIPVKTIKRVSIALGTIFSIAFIYVNFIAPMEFASTTSGSERIEWDDSETLRDEYEDSKMVRVKYTTSAGRDTTPFLKGFVFDASHLDEIINSNRSYLGNPDEVVFYLGQEGSFSTGIWPFSTRHPILYLIAAGIKNDTLLRDNNRRVAGPSLFDKADPCPPNCPKYTSIP